MLTNKQQFRFGFLQKCAELGMTAEQATDFAETAVIIVKEAMLAKQSAKTPVGAAGEAIAGAGGPSITSLLMNNPITAGLTSAGQAIGNTLGGYALPFALGAPPALGALAGYSLAKATDADDETIKAIRKRELIDEIRRNRLLLEQKRRTYRPTA